MKLFYFSHRVCLLSQKKGIFKPMEVVQTFLLTILFDKITSFLLVVRASARIHVRAAGASEHTRAH